MCTLLEAHCPSKTKHGCLLALRYFYIVVHNSPEFVTLPGPKILAQWRAYYRRAGHKIDMELVR